MPSLAEIMREHGAAYAARFGARLLPSHRRALADIAGCRTAARLVCCPHCGSTHWHRIGPFVPAGALPVLPPRGPPL